MASGRKLKPFGHSGRAVLLEDTAATEMAVLVEMIVDRGMCGSKFLPGLDVPEPVHRSFSSSKRSVCVFGPVIEPTPTFLTLQTSNNFHRRTVGSKSVGHDRLWSAIALHRSFEKLQRSRAIPAFRGKNFEYLAFMIDGAPQIMRLAVDPHKRFVQVPSPSGIRSILLDTPLPDLRGKNRTEPAPPETDCIAANVDATLKQQIFDLPQRKRIADLHHHREADHLGRTVEIPEGILHCRKLWNAAPRLKPI